MFEYTTLVEAPVQRFTAIVTGPDPLDEMVVSVQTPSPPVVVPVVEAPVLLVVAEPAFGEPIVEQPAPSVMAAITTTTARPVPSAANRTAPASRPAAVARPASKPAFIPALVGAAVGGLTAMWWLRRWR